MKEKYTELALNYFKNGFSCSESVVKAAIDLGLAQDNLLDVATSFSGGMGSGCLCGAAAGAQMVIGAMYGRNKDNSAREKAKVFVEKFRGKLGATCCRVLTKGFDFHSKERKEHCMRMVKTSAEILCEIIPSEVRVN